MRVLFVLDDPALESLLEQQVHSLGFETEVADPDGFAPAPGLTENHEAVFVGGAAPQPSHFDAVRDLTRSRRDDLPVVILVTRRPASEEDFERGEAARVDGWLEPPFTAARVASVLKEAGERLAQRERERERTGSGHLLAEIRSAVAGLPPEVTGILVRSFVSDTGSMVGEIGPAARREDIARLKFVCHKIAGASATLGARNLAALCRQVEYGAAADTVALAVALLPGIESAYRETLACLDQAVPNGDGITGEGNDKGGTTLS